MLRAILPVFLLLLIAGAALAIGADSPAAALFFSGSVSVLSVAALIMTRRFVGFLVLAGLIGSVALFLFGITNGWISTGAGEYAVLVSAFGILAIGKTAGRDTETVEIVWRATMIVGAFLAAASFVDFIIDPGMLWGISERPYGGDRFATPFLSANTAATFYGIIALMGFADLSRAIRRFNAGAIDSFEALMKAGALPLATILVSLTCVLLTASRAGITFLTGSLLLLTVWELVQNYRMQSGGNLKIASIGILSIATIGAIFFLSGGDYADRIMQQGADDSVREQTFAAYFEAVAMAPVFGHGLGGFFYVNSLIAEAQNAPTLMFQGAAHNVVLQWLLQGGVIGLAFILAISLTWLHLMRQGLVRRRRQTGYIRAAIVIALFVTAHGMFDYALEIPAFLFLFVWVCGLGLGVATGGSRSTSTGRTIVQPRVLNVSAAAILAVTALLSFWAFTDRASGQRIIDMDEQVFRETIAGESQLHGSHARLAAIGDRALRLNPPDAELAAQAFALASEREPRDGVLHLRFAIARIAELGAVTPDAVAALTRSYTVMPYAPRDMVDWRLDVIEGTWSFLPPAVQEAALREARAYRRLQRIERLSRLAEPEPNQ